MTQVLLAVDFEFDLILFELLSDIEDVSIVARPADDVELLALCRTGSAEVVIVGQYFPGLDAEVISAVTASGAKVLGFGDDARALEALGITASVGSSADADEIASALESLCDSTVVPPRPTAPPGTRGGQGTIITVWGTGSSPGRSVTAVNLADHAARQGHRSVVVDADTVSATIAALLGLTEESAHLASLCRLEAEKTTTGHGSLPHATIREDFHAITGLTKADRWPEIRASALEAVLHRLARSYDLVVVDVCDGIDPDDDLADPFYDRHCATRAAVEAADTVLLLAAGDPIGLQRLIKLLGTGRAESLRPKAKIGITKVRPGAVGQPAEARIREVLGRFVRVEPDFILSDDRTTLDAAMLAGRTLHEQNPKSVLSREIAELAEELLPGRKRMRKGTGQRGPSRRTKVR